MTPNPRKSPDVVSRISGVPKDRLHEYWREAAPFIQRGLDFDDGRFDLAHIYLALRDEQMQLWVAHHDKGMHAACVTQILIFPVGKVLRALYAGGRDIDGALWFDEVLAEFAREKGCGCVEIIGRRGWLRKFHGFRETHTIMRRDV